ncbi:Succinate dehydrogenase assembly factor 4, mitochondrial [Cytospora mali]|uniref:Succinate dehydrogenase assembly factor 4, mitochondrial n=1 Tax=Cytospora mali TaxID=578113 RepID=A0A194WBZ8_CYTMA|nr:Succinate dehydrogenase assembly factor 4, mitochondrial [Valsa mali]
MPSVRLLPPSTLRLLRASSTAPSPTIRAYSSAFQNHPSPPRLPAEQQAEFERLQRAVADRFADPTPLPHETPQPSPTATSRHVSTPDGRQPGDTSAKVASAEEVTTGGVWRGAPPEFEGEKNPKTGEVGGPKTEPLRWGSAGDWSYNGRVTDF